MRAESFLSIIVYRVCLPAVVRICAACALCRRAPGFRDSGAAILAPGLAVVDDGVPTARREVVDDDVLTAGPGVGALFLATGDPTLGLPRSGGVPSVCRVSKCSSYVQGTCPRCVPKRFA